MKNKSAICFYAALFAAIAIISANIAGCGAPEAAKTNKTTETALVTVPDTISPELADLVPSLDYKGYEFTILTSATNSQHAYFSVNEATGDVFDDAMYARTQAIAEKFNITMKDITATTSDEALTMFSNSVLAGDAEYDIAMLLERRAFAMTGENYFLDQSTLEYIDFTRPYWINDVNEAINLSSAYYLTYGEAVLPIFDMMHVMLFNKNMIENLSLDSPYDLVLDDTWTYEKFKTMAKAAAKDADGDSVWTDKDVYGIIGGNNSIASAFITGAKQRTIEINAESVPVIKLLENEKIYDLITDICASFWSGGFYYNPSGNSNNYHLTDKLFETDQALFADYTLYTVKSLRDMTSDFGIIPFPKYDEVQDGYATMVEAGTRVTTVPVTTKYPELVGAVLETMNFLSHKDVMPAYYEITLQQKVSRDNVSMQMLDLIKSSVYYDLGNTMFNDTIKDGIFSVLFRAKGSGVYISTVTGKLNSIQEAIKKATG